MLCTTGTYPGQLSARTYLDMLFAVDMLSSPTPRITMVIRGSPTKRPISYDLVFAVSVKQIETQASGFRHVQLRNWSICSLIIYTVPRYGRKWALGMWLVAVRPVASRFTKRACQETVRKDKLSFRHLTRYERVRFRPAWKGTCVPC